MSGKKLKVGECHEKRPSKGTATRQNKKKRKLMELEQAKKTVQQNNGMESDTKECPPELDPSGVALK